MSDKEYWCEGAEQIMDKVKKDAENFTEEQSHAFFKAAAEEQLVKLNFTLNESTTLMEVLRETYAVALMRGAVDGYPKDILGTMVKAADDMLPRIAEATTKNFERLNERIELTSSMKES